MTPGPVPHLGPDLEGPSVVVPGDHPIIKKRYGNIDLAGFNILVAVSIEVGAA